MIFISDTFQSFAAFITSSILIDQEVNNSYQSPFQQLQNTYISSVTKFRHPLFRSITLLLIHSYKTLVKKWGHAASVLDCIHIICLFAINLFLFPCTFFVLSCSSSSSCMLSYNIMKNPQLHN